MSTSAPAAPADAAAAPPASFEAAIAELESLVTRLESGDVSLEAAIAGWRRGSTLLRWCEQALAQAEQQVRVLDGDALRDLDGDDRGTD
ncbi:MAG: exodeoxyribonuclease VII small subunit [Burkholderiales bacterium]|jgi:exodeoxyribonuclease VII small subunit|nr:exodeoxyribonuclease VII small subunit [Burkholderiales bacterium]